MRPLLALTPGEPAGIGPDLCIALAQAGLAANIVVIADPELLRQRALLLQLPLRCCSGAVRCNLAGRTISTDPSPNRRPPPLDCSSDTRP